MTITKKRILVYLGTLAVLVLIVQFPYISSLFKPSGVEQNSKDVNTIQTESLPKNQLVIESLGIVAPIVYAEKNNENYFQELLRSGVVHYPGTAEVGSVGNCYIFGHASDYVWSKGNYKTVFSKLPNIKVGAEIKITDPSGKQFKYIVRSYRVVETTEVSVLSQETGGKAILTLQTSYPVGTALRRFVVISELVN